MYPRPHRTHHGRGLDNGDFPRGGIESKVCVASHNTSIWTDLELDWLDHVGQCYFQWQDDVPTGRRTGLTWAPLESSQLSHEVCAYNNYQLRRWLLFWMLLIGVSLTLFTLWPSILFKHSLKMAQSWSLIFQWMRQQSWTKTQRLCIHLVTFLGSYGHLLIRCVAISCEHEW